MPHICLKYFDLIKSKTGPRTHVAVSGRTG